MTHWSKLKAENLGRACLLPSVRIQGVLGIEQFFHKNIDVTTRQPSRWVYIMYPTGLALVDLHTKFSGTRPPAPTGPNSFIFTYIFTKKHLRQRSMPPPNGSTPPNGKSRIRPCLGSNPRRFGYGY